MTQLVQQFTYAFEKNLKLTKAFIDAMDAQTCEERLKEAIESTLIHPFSASWLPNVVKTGSAITHQSMNLPTALTVAFQDLVFLGHLQRDLVISHLSNIIKDFDPFQVQPPRVFWSELLKKYVVVDGQHTTVALWIIYTYILLANPSQLIPITIMPGTLEDLGTDQLRALFLNINGNSEPIAEADKHRLYVITHRTTNDNSTQALQHAKMQEIVESGDMFFTHEYKADKFKPGAMTRFSEWKTESEDVLRRFAEYMKITVAPHRAITVHEQDILIEFFNLHAKDNTTHWTPEEIHKVFAWANQGFYHDFVKHGVSYKAFPGSLYDKCRLAVYGWVDATPDVAASMRENWASQYYLMGVVLFAESLRAANTGVSLPSVTTMKNFARIKACGFWPSASHLVK